jgi:hypothetical protein
MADRINCPRFLHLIRCIPLAILDFQAAILLAIQVGQESFLLMSFTEETKSPSNRMQPKTVTSGSPPLSLCDLRIQSNIGILDHKSSLRNRRALLMTEIELNVIAALAIIGFSRSPKKG